jgi:hypothetical protein
MKKQYQLTYADGYDMTVEVDHSILTDEKAHELNNFWSGAQDRIDRRRGDIIETVLTMLCVEFMQLSVEHLDPEAAFNNGEVEGWPPLDGSWGIKLVHYEPFEFESALVDVMELP